LRLVNLLVIQEQEIIKRKWEQRYNYRISDREIVATYVKSQICEPRHIGLLKAHQI